MSYFKAKMYQIQFRLAGGAYSAPPDPPARLRGPTSKARGGNQKRREGRKGKGGVGKGRGGDETAPPSRPSNP